ncbi:hypothetical protein B0H11DRAFT_2096578 [Mycena galericulata]|nr:hypothetical protein B0H11DRAFT_2096578 [Mycena galericulata]
MVLPLAAPHTPRNSLQSFKKTLHIQDSNVKERQAPRSPSLRHFSCAHSHFLVTQLSDKIFGQVLPSFKSHHKLRHTSDLDWIWTFKSSSTSVFKPLSAAHVSRLVFYQGNTRCSRPRRYLLITLPDLSYPCRGHTTPRSHFSRHPMAHVSHAPHPLPVGTLSCLGDQLPQSDRVRAACQTTPSLLANSEVAYRTRLPSLSGVQAEAVTARRAGTRRRGRSAQIGFGWRRGPGCYHS